MAISRYSYVTNNKDSLGKEYKNIFINNKAIFNAIESGTISYSSHVLEEGERLDILSGYHYGDSSYWWILAAASGIGWGLQVPPGTIIRIPNNINEVFGVLS